MRLHRLMDCRVKPGGDEPKFSLVAQSVSRVLQELAVISRRCRRVSGWPIC